MALTCIKRRTALLAAIVALAVPGAMAQGAPDTDVVAAKEAAQRGDWKTLDVLRQRLAGHPLEAYPAYWALSGALDRVPDADVQAFLARYPDSPLAESLRREWLKLLGAAGNWTLFRAEHPKLVNDDAEVACYALQERLASGDADAASEARALYLAGRESPGACDTLFAALVVNARVSPDDTWIRLRKLLAANLVRDARRTSGFLSARETLAEKSIDRAAADPSGFLAKDKSSLATRAQREVTLFAVERLARSKPEEAAERLERVAARLGAEDTRYAWGRIALQAALNHDAHALAWYERAGDLLTDTQIAWRARAAMRAGNWKAVLAAIQALSPEEQRDPTWRYWRSRALRQLGEREAADGLLKTLARETNFYGLLAAEELGTVAAPDWKGWHPEAADLERVRALPGIQRALALYRLGLDSEGVREWIWAVRALPDRDLLAAAELARQANITDRAINTAERTVQLHDYAQRYPTPHREPLEAAAKQWDMDEALVYGIIRQESRFNPEARSRAGALGLMQLMPATARWVARQIPVNPFNPAMLTRPELNLRMGTYYLRRVLQDLGDKVLAMAAYNAGPGRARRWRDERPLEGAIYVETIPFNETRDYVKKVATNVWFYSHRLKGQAPGLRQILGTIPGRAGEPADGAVAATIP
jgi:soluble lytic murein transglycosylase